MLASPGGVHVSPAGLTLKPALSSPSGQNASWIPGAQIDPLPLLCLVSQVTCHFNVRTAERSWKKSYSLVNWYEPLLMRYKLISFLRVTKTESLSRINNQFPLIHSQLLTATAAKSLQSCLTLCDPIDGSPLGSSVPGILQARTLEWVAISFSNA